MASSTTGSGGSGWTPPTVEELQQLLPQYEIEKILGHGGMGAVYKGQQAQLGRSVAIKVLPETLITEDDDHQYVERFKLEARAMANLDHPAIISVHDFGQTDVGHLYFVMEYIDGMDIEEYIFQSGGTVDPDHAVAIVSHVLDALEYAHSKGIVHRDIKPANVLINREGRVKIADFGLAKEFVGDDGAAVTGLTMTNMAMGTPDYIAPEALDSDAVPDHRADLYAVGVMLYKMLTGKLPRGMFKLPSEQNESLDRRFDEIIASAMESDPGGRFQNASEFRRKLDELQSAPVTKVEPQQDTSSVTPVVSGSQLEFPASGVQARKQVARSQMSRKVPKNRDKQSPAKAVALIAAAVLVVGLSLYFLFGKKPDVPASGIPESEAPVSQAKKTHTEKKPSPDPSSEHIDLLALVDPDRDAVNGEWKLTDGRLMRENIDGIASLRIPYTTPENYTFRAVVTPIDTGKEINFAFPVFGHHVKLVIGGWNGLAKAPITALSRIDGLPGPNNATSIARHSLEPGRTYAVEITVSGSSETAQIEVMMDDERIISWSGNPKILSVDLVWWEERSRDGEPSIYLHHPGPSVAKFTELTLIPQEPSKRSETTSEKVTTGDLLAAIDPSRDARNGEWQIEDGAIFRTNTTGPATLAIPGAVENSLAYRFQASIDPIEEPCPTSFLIPVGGNYVEVCFGGWPLINNGPVSGLSKISGIPTPENETRVSSHTLEPGRSYSFEASVSGSEDESTIQISLEGEEFISWTGNSEELSTSMNVESEDGVENDIIYLHHSQSGSAKFSQLRVRNIENSQDAPLPETTGLPSNTPQADTPDRERLPTAEALVTRKESKVEIPDLPDLLSRLDSYRQYRKQTLGNLISSYRAALQKHKDAAISSGDLDGVENANLAVATVNKFTGTIASLLEGSEIAPISPPPPTEGIAGPLQKLEADLRNQFEAAEQDMTEKLGQSLTICETALTKNNQIEEALAAREFRLALMTRMTDPNQAASEAILDSNDWQELFNLSDPGEWEVKGDAGRFEIIDGVIIGRASSQSRGAYFFTRKSYDDFELEFEVKRNNGVNAGVQIRSKFGQINGRAEQVHGPQVEIKDSPGNSGFLYGQGMGGGWLEGEKVMHDYLRNDEWNRFRVLAKGPRIQTWVNDHPAADFTSDELYSDYSDGFIALQILRPNSPTDLEVRWRNMRIRKLTDSESAPSTPEPEAAFIELFNGRDLDGWTPNKSDTWTVEDGAIMKRGGTPPELSRVVPFSEFEIEGEMRTSSLGNGGIIVEKVAELALVGSKDQKSGGIWTGGIWGFGPNLQRKATPSSNDIRDDTWTSFRLRYENDSFQTWLSEKEVSQIDTVPSTEKSHTIKLQGKPTGEVGYRKLRIKDLSSE